MLEYTDYTSASLEVKENVMNIYGVMQDSPRHVFTAFSLRLYVHDRSEETVRDTINLMMTIGLPIVATDAPQGAWLYVG